mgnify:CR=1 FL=1
MMNPASRVFCNCCCLYQTLLSQYHFVSYIYSYTEFEPWSRAKALNIGLKNSNMEKKKMILIILL